MLSDGARLPELLTHASWLRRLALSLVRDPDVADDVVQGVWLSAWTHPPSTPSGERGLRPWLAEVARNRAHDQRRGDARRRTHEAAAGDELDDRAQGDPEKLIGDLEIHRMVAEVVTGLDEPYRSTLVLHYYEAVPAADIARRLGIPAGTVRWRLKEALDRVRVALDARHDGDRPRWQRALLPLLPASAWPAAPAQPAAPGPAPPTAAPGKPGLAGLAGAALVLVLAATAVFWAYRRFGNTPSADGQSRGQAEHRATPVPAESVATNRGRTAALPRFAGPAVPDDVAAQAAPQNRANEILTGMLAAIARNQYEDFLLHAHDIFKARLDKDTLAGLSGDLGHRLQGGYEVQALGSLRQSGYTTFAEEEFTVFLWKLEFRDGGDDVLVRMMIKDEQVVGFFVQ